MMSNESFPMDNNHHFVISHELLALLQWLVEHDAEKLKKLVTKALASGLKEEIHRIKYNRDIQQEEVHYSVIEFFGLLESLLYETVHEQTMQHAVEKNLMPAIDQIDSSVIDDATIRFSVDKATNRLNKSPEENPQELLFKELLRCWKPGNKKVVN